MITLTFYEDKDYSALEWLGWRDYVICERKRGQSLGADIYYSTEMYRDETGAPITVQMKLEKALFHLSDTTAISFIDYCSDMAELKAWYQEMDKQEHAALLVITVMCAECSLDDYLSVRDELVTIDDDDIDHLHYWWWAEQQLKDGYRLSELPGWEE